MPDRLSVQFVLIRANGVEERAPTSTMADYIAALGIDSVQHTMTVNGEEVVVKFEFDPPLAPKSKGGADDG